MFAEEKTHFDAEKKIWSGRKVVLSEYRDSFGQWALDNLLKDPDTIAQICDNNGLQYTKREIATLSIRVAQHLQQMGLQQEDVIGICAVNTDFLCPLVIGALLCGLIISPLGPEITNEDSYRKILSLTRPKLMFCDGKVYDKVKALLGDEDLSIPIYTMTDHLTGVKQIQELITPTERETFPFKGPALKNGPGQIAFIVCSSGTTGPPKVISVSHDCLLFLYRINTSSQERCKFLYFGTIHWAGILAKLFYQCVAGVTVIITNQKFSPELFLRIVKEQNITRVDCSPADISAVIHVPDFKKRDLTSLKLYVTSGSCYSFDIIENFLKQAKFCEAVCRYGMSEGFAVMAMGPAKKEGNVGQLRVNYKMKVVNESGEKLDVHEMGELCIKTPFIWPGYYKNPEATKAIYDEDGWLRTGDIGYFNDEGCLFVIDRKVDVLKYNNSSIYPALIEMVIMEIPDVVGVCVCGINDLCCGSLPAAAVVKAANSKLTKEHVKNYVAQKMDNHMQLRGGVYFFESLPRTSTGKCIRSEVMKTINAL